MQFKATFPNGQPFVVPHVGMAADAPRSDSPATKLRPCNEHGLGDTVENALAAIGITEERVGMVLQMFGLPPGCSGCAKRKAWLNEVSAWWRKSAK